jgi:hypothetical protein
MDMTVGELTEAGLAESGSVDKHLPTPSGWP